MDLVYRSGGIYLGFISNNYLFSRDGVYMGWIDGNYVWDSFGRFRGTLINRDGYKYIWYNQLVMPPNNRTPKTAPTNITPPTNPVAVISPVNPPVGYKDSF
jgi:hypothetical protein